MVTKLADVEYDCKKGEEISLELLGALGTDIDSNC